MECCSNACIVADVAKDRLNLPNNTVRPHKASLLRIAHSHPHAPPILGETPRNIPTDKTGSAKNGNKLGHETRLFSIQARMYAAACAQTRYFRAAFAGVCMDVEVRVLFWAPKHLEIAIDTYSCSMVSRARPFAAFRLSSTDLEEAPCKASYRSNGCTTPT